MDQTQTNIGTINKNKNSVKNSLKTPLQPYKKRQNLVLTNQSRAPGPHH